MQTYIAILRGINVSGRNRVNMKELRSLCEGLGWGNVRTYIQSGNVLFEYKNEKEGELADMLVSSIKAEMKLEVPVLIRSLTEWKKAAEANPFLEEKDVDKDKLHITFLQEKPLKEHIEKANTYNYEPDRFIIGGKEVYVYCPNGYGNTKLNNTFFENKLKVQATTRNLKTVNKLLEMGGE